MILMRQRARRSHDVGAIHDAPKEQSGWGVGRAWGQGVATPIRLACMGAIDDGQREEIGAGRGRFWSRIHDWHPRYKGRTYFRGGNGQPTDV